ncbi:MAG: hypothetical protein H6747_15415 [Deltaproteobacteria bacterium]|nr:hypothetical protein [Deltaproteobacteria bacterium]
MRLHTTLRTLTLLLAGTLAVACADVGGGGGGDGADTSTGGGTDATGGNDSTGGGGTDGTGGGGTDGTGGTAQVVTIKEMQEEMEKLDCTKFSFTNGPKGVKLVDVIVASPIQFKAIQSKNGDLDAAYVQTKGGGLWNGIYVTAANGGEFGKLKQGTTVTLEGEVKDYYCATQFDAKVITPGTAAVEIPVAVTLTLDKLGDKAAETDNEAAEGVLVSLENLVVSDNEPLGTDGKPHGEFYVGKDKSDKSVLVAPGFSTTFSKKGDDGNYRAIFEVGKEFKSIRGIVTYSFGKWRLIPVGDAGLDAK